MSKFIFPLRADQMAQFIVDKSKELAKKKTVGRPPGDGFLERIYIKKIKKNSR